MQCVVLFNFMMILIPNHLYLPTYNPQLHDSVAKLVTENLYVKRWLFKMDNEFDGRGTGEVSSVQIRSCHIDNCHK